MGALWGLLAAGLIGCADSAARVTAQRVPIPHLILFTSWLALPIGLLLFGVPDLTSAPLRWSASLALVGGFLHVGALVLLFRALADGPVSVAVAGTASGTVFLITWNVLAGEPWSLVQLFAGIGVFFGVAMATRPERGPAETRDPRQLRTTALLGLGAGFLSSVRLFLVQEASVEIGPGDAMVAMRFGAAAAILPVVLIGLRGRMDALRIPSGRLGVLVILQTLLETAALLALLHGSVSASRVGAAVGFAALPAASTIAARLFLGDAIGRRRGWWILFVVACVGVATLAGGLVK